MHHITWIMSLVHMKTFIHSIFSTKMPSWFGCFTHLFWKIKLLRFVYFFVANFKSLKSRLRKFFSFWMYSYKQEHFQPHQSVQKSTNKLGTKIDCKCYITLQVMRRNMSNLLPKVMTCPKAVTSIGIGISFPVN